LRSYCFFSRCAQYLEGCTRGIQVRNFAFKVAEGLFKTRRCSPAVAA